MKVKDLIERLQSFDGDTEVHISQDRHDYGGHIDACKVLDIRLAICRIDPLVYNTPTIVHKRIDEHSEKYVALLTLFA